jgi:hypothetical protein
VWNTMTSKGSEFLQLGSSPRPCPAAHEFFCATFFCALRGSRLPPESLRQGACGRRVASVRAQRASEAGAVTGGGSGTLKIAM